MPSAEYDATPREVRNFALLQIGLVGGFLILLFFMLGGTDADFPPLWLTVLLVLVVGAGAFFAERVWLSASPLSPDLPARELRGEAVGIYAGQTVRKLFYCSASLLPAILVAFVGDHGGWPIAISGFPGIAVLMWEIYPSLRNTSMTAAMLDSQGAESHLVESFLES